MVLSFSETFPWGKEPSNRTSFKQKIQEEQKTTTFRSGNRWSKFNKIHFYSGSPRNGGTPFNLNYHSRRVSSWEDHPDFVWPNSDEEPYYPLHSEAVPLVCKVENFEIVITKPGPTKFYLIIEDQVQVRATVEGAYASPVWKCSWEGNLADIACKDGFDDPAAFIAWFLLSAKRKEVNNIVGQRIHWIANLNE